MTAETGTLARNIGSTFKKVSGWYIAFGVVVALGGIVAIARPLTAGLALTLVIGWILILNGVMAVVSAFAARNAGGFIAQLLLAGAYVLGGVYVLSNPVQGLTALAFVLGLTLFLGGGFKLMLAAALSGVPGIGALILSGVVSIILAVMIWMRLPESSEAVVGLLLGIDFLMTGASMIVTGVSGRMVVSALS